MFLKVLADTLQYCQDEEETVTNTEADQEIVEVAAKLFAGENCYGQNVGDDSKAGDNHRDVATNNNIDLL